MSKTTEQRSCSKKSKPSVTKKLKQRLDRKWNEEINALDLRDVIYEDINDTYARGKIGPFDLIMNKTNGYFNASKMCSDAIAMKESKQDFNEWTRTGRSKRVQNEVSKVYPGFPPNDLLKKVTNVPTELRGWYVHPRLVIPIANWISPRFEIMASAIVSNYYVKDFIAEKDTLIKEQKRELGEHVSTINDLNRKIDELMKQNKKQSKKLGNKIDIVSKKNDKILSAVKRVTSERAPSTGNKGDDGVLIIVENRDKPIKGKKSWTYNVLRLINNSYNSSINVHKRNHPNMKVIKKLNCEPNAMKLWKRVKSKLTVHNEETEEDAIIEAKIGSFNITNDEYDIYDVIDKMIEISNEKDDIGVDNSDDESEEDLDDCEESDKDCYASEEDSD